VEGELEEEDQPDGGLQFLFAMRMVRLGFTQKHIKTYLLKTYVITDLTIISHVKAIF
jgi:hypothetical protein